MADCNSYIYDLGQLTESIYRCGFLTESGPLGSSGIICGAPYSLYRRRGRSRQSDNQICDFNDQANTLDFGKSGDETAVRTMLQRYLERNGYRVFPASSGEDAIHVFAREHAGVELLVTDLVMPGISGHDLALRLRELQPALPILFMSGYADQLSDSPENIPCLRKPLDLKRLVETIAGLTTSESESAHEEPTAA